MTLAPRGVFGDWSVTRRLGVLGRIEQALLDPENIFAQAGVRVRFARFANEAEVLSLREELQRLDRQDLMELLEPTAKRSQTLGGFDEIAAYVNPEAFRLGDIVGGVNEFFRPGIEAVPLFPWLKSPTIGYRDYLRDRWVDHMRLQHMLGQGTVEVATRATLIERLNNRFHQDFATGDTTDQPANRVLVRILLKVLPAPPGPGYGFGIAPAGIEPQGERSYREYLDYLISLTGLSLEELEKRYRLNLQRSDLERANPVQQNIDTLQRFFTDSYQSVDDPYAIKPDRVAATEELLIINFPRDAAGPFFLEYEEWLARDEPFYPENHYDPRETYALATGPGVREAVFAKSKPLGEFLNEKSKGG